MSYARNNRPLNFNSRKEFHQNGEERNGFNNPQFGPNTQITNERWEQEVKAKLDEFIRGDAPDLHFPPMDSHLRKRIHELARRKHLQSKSIGVEGYRNCVITRRRNNNLITLNTAQETQVFQLNDRQKESIENLVKKMPITSDEIDHHVKTKHASVLKRDSENQSRYDNRPQVPPVCDVNPKIADFRRRLPVMIHRDEIMNAINRNPVTIITGGTGCGKTTQVPQFLLEESQRDCRPIRIICTQPRRLPAIAVAERVAVERGERLGDTVGYHIRLEQRTSEKTVLTYCTSGVLLRMLSQKDGWCGATHVILDEVHERERNTDYLLIALREALKENRRLKVILMSATLEGNLDLFMNYFRDFQLQHINVPSRLFTVQKFHLGAVLALTAYTPPQSAFNTGMWNDDASAEQSGSFPVIGRFPGASFNAFNDRGMHAVHTAPNLQTTFSQPNLHNLAHQIARITTNESQQQQPHQDKYGYGQSSQDIQRTNQPYRDDVVDLPLSDDEGQNSGQEKDGNAFYQDAQPSISNQGYDGNKMGEYHHYQPQQLHHSSWPHQHSVPDLQQMNHHQFVHDQQGRHQQHHGALYQPHTGFYVGGSSFGQQNGENYYDGTSGYMHGGGSEQQYAMQIAQENYRMNSYRHQLGTSILLQMYPSFQEEAVKKLEGMIKSGELDENQLVNMYMKCGGNAYEENIDPELCLHLIRYLINSPIEGAILVFLPGIDDISQIRIQLEQLNHMPIHQGGYHNRLLLFSLHSQLQSFEQQKVFDRTPENCRKIILSTNIAEASLTIDDVVFVIDCGKVKEKTYDHDSRISQLKVQRIAKSNAEQRSGRAGRCRPGFCFRLYSLREYDGLQTTQMAEMQRLAIHEVVLHAKMFAGEGISVRDFISKAPEPPRCETLDHSIQFLQQLGALYINEEETEEQNSMRNAFSMSGGFYKSKKPTPEPALTSLGRLIAVLPLEPQLARLLLFGVVLKCLDPILNLVSVLSHTDPFLIASGGDQEERDRIIRAKMEYSHRDLSDQLMLIRTVNEYMTIKGNNQQRWCQSKYIRSSTMRMIAGIRHQLRRELVRAGIVRLDENQNVPELNWNSHSWAMIRAAIVAGCYPGLGFVKQGNRLKRIHTSNDSHVQLHSSSIVRRQLNFGKPSDPCQRFDDNSSEPQIEFVVFQEMVRVDQQLTLKTVTVVPPLAAILFTGAIRLKKSTFDCFRICSIDDDEIPEEVEEEPSFGSFQSYSIIELDDWFATRGRFSQLRTILKLRFRLMDYFLQVMEKPDLLYTTDKFDDLLLTLRDCLEEDHLKHNFNRVTDLPKTEMPDRKEMRRAGQQSRSEDSHKTCRVPSSTTQATPSSSFDRNYNDRNNRDNRHKSERDGERPRNLTRYEGNKPKRMDENKFHNSTRRQDDDPIPYQQERQHYDGNYQQSYHDDYHDQQWSGSRVTTSGRYQEEANHHHYHGNDRASKQRPIGSSDVRMDQKRGGFQAARGSQDNFNGRNNRTFRSRGGCYSSSLNENHHHPKPPPRRRHQDDEWVPQDPPQPQSSNQWRLRHGYDNCTTGSPPPHDMRGFPDELPPFDDPNLANIDEYEEEAPNYPNPSENRNRGGGRRGKGNVRVYENKNFKKYQQHSEKDRDHFKDGGVGNYRNNRRGGGYNQRGGRGRNQNQ